LGSRRTLVERNIALKFPELSQTEIQQLAKNHFKNLAACLAETAFAWFKCIDDSVVPFRIEGHELVYSALRQGRGVILYTGHFTSIEICGHGVKKLFPNVAILFHPRRNPLVNEFQRRGRQHSCHLSFADNDIRSMLRALQNKAVVWYAADQSHSHYTQQLRRKGEKALGDTTACRVARLSGATVVALSYYRSQDDSGYVLRFGPAIEEFPADQDSERARMLGQIMQDLIAQCPAQYGWTYKRLRRPDQHSLCADEIDTLTKVEP
jgi:KDO2-lipid IV(A) lauroyltransferase